MTFRTLENFGKMIDLRERGYDLCKLKIEGNWRKSEGMGLNEGVGVLNVEFFLKT